MSNGGANGGTATAIMQGSGPETVLSNAALASVVNIGVLSNKIALITGGSSGLGRAMAQAYAGAGAFVVSADLTPNLPKSPILEETMKARGDFDLVTNTVDLLNKYFPSKDGIPRSIFVQCDVTKPETVEAAVKAAVAQYGRLDIMVNNAGIAMETEVASPLTTPLHLTDVSVFDKTMAVNARGVWLGIKYAVGQMLEQPPHPSGDRGWIINISSIYGLVAGPGASAYCSSKGAVTNMTRASALEYAKDKIHINSIHPGFAETSLLESMKRNLGNEAATEHVASLHPWGRLAWPEDIAKMAVFLAGEGASFCTGSRKCFLRFNMTGADRSTEFVVDGGYTAR